MMQEDGNVFYVSKFMFWLTGFSNAAIAEYYTFEHPRSDAAVLRLAGSQRRRNDLVARRVADDICQLFRLLLAV